MFDYGLAFRLLLVLGSLATLLYVLRRVRQAKMQIEDSIFWILFSLVPLFLSLFPNFAYWAARVLGFQSPINVIYLVIIFLLLIKQFFMSLHVSQIESKLKVLAQKVALNEEKFERRNQDL